MTSDRDPAVNLPPLDLDPIPAALPGPALDPALQAGDPVAWTRTLVGIPSVNPSLEAGGGGEGEVAALVAQALRGWGFEVEEIMAEPGPATVTEPLSAPVPRPSVVARCFQSGPRAPTVLLCGHLDTVGIAGMQVPPFGATSSAQPQRLWGRGAADMKSGVAAILYAAARYAARCAESPDAGSPPASTPAAVNLVVALTADEEHASIGLEALLAGGSLAGPGGSKVDFAVVCEPTSLALAPANKGFLWVTVEAQGRAAHGSRPEIGRDAIRQLARFIAALDALDAPPHPAAHPHPAAPPHPAAHPLLGDGSFHMGTIQGGAAPSVYPEHASLELEVRLLPNDTPARWVSALRGLAEQVERHSPGIPLTLTPGLFRPGANLSVDHPWVGRLAEALAAEEVPVRIEPMTAWVESAWLMEAGIPALCFGPGSIAQAHTADEWVDVDEIVIAARVLDAFLRGAPAPADPGSVTGARA